MAMFYAKNGVEVHESHSWFTRPLATASGHNRLPHEPLRNEWRYSVLPQGPDRTECALSGTSWGKGTTCPARCFAADRLVAVAVFGCSGYPRHSCFSTAELPAEPECKMRYLDH